jgi:hypothetical protein
MSRLLADIHVPQMERTQMAVSKTRGREVLRAQSAAGLLLLVPHLAAVIVCQERPVRTGLSSVQIALQSARVAASGQPVQLPVAAARAVRVSVHFAARLEHAPTRIVRSSALRARLMAMRDSSIVHGGTATRGQGAEGCSCKSHFAWTNSALIRRGS